MAEPGSGEGGDSGAAGRLLVLYDGDCGFCSASVAQIHRADRKRLFWFAPLQGETARPYLERHPELANLSTVVLVEDFGAGLPGEGRVFVRSDAVVEICRRLGGWRRWFVWGKWIPRRLRDGMYDLVARNRRKLIAKRGCEVPGESLRARLLP